MNTQVPYKRATSFQDYLDSLKEYQYVSYSIQLSDCKDPAVRSVVGRRCYMLDFLFKNFGKEFQCPDALVKRLVGITVTESEWLWAFITEQGRHNYYPEDDFQDLKLIVPEEEQVISWKYPEFGELPGSDGPISCFTCLVDSEGQVRYTDMIFDPALECWRDPITGEENEDVNCVNKWVSLVELLNKIQG